MHAAQRRDALLELLRTSRGPVSATALARRFSVSRQIIVGDIALLRAGGADIASTPRGYVIPAQEDTGLTCTLVCRHTAGQLQLSSRYDVAEFIRRVEKEQATPLSALTGGVHLHRLRCPDEAACRRVCQALDEAGFLVKE